MMAKRNAYAVVIFIDGGSTETESASEVPSNWLEDNATKCWWPTSKNVGPHILKRTRPDKNDPTKWQLHDAECLGFYDSLSSARQKANGVSSGDETSLPAAAQRDSCLSAIMEEKQIEKQKYFKRKSGFSADKKQDDYRKKNGVKVVSHITLPENYHLKNNSILTQLQENAENPTAKFSGDTNGNTMSFLDFEGPSMKDFLINLSDKICTKIGELTFAMRSTTDRLVQIERILNTNNLPTPTTDDDDFAAVLPLRTIEEVQEFEMHLTITDLKQRLVGGSSAKDCLVRTQKKVFGPEAAKQSSWCGQRGNFKVCGLAVIDVIRGEHIFNKCNLKNDLYIQGRGSVSTPKAAKWLFACTDKYFEEEAKEWFRQGTEKYARIQKKALAE